MFMFGSSFDKLKKFINSTNDPKDMDKAIEKLANLKFDPKLFDDINNRHGELNKDNLPHALLSLYKSNRKSDTALFCMLIVACCKDIPYIPPLENYPIFDEKLEYVYSSLATVFERCFDGVGDCMALVMLNNDPKLEHADEKIKPLIFMGILNRLKVFNEFTRKYGPKSDDRSWVQSMAITLDLSTYANDPDIIAEINQLKTLEIDPEAQLFLLKTMAANNIEGARELVPALVDFDAERLFRILESVGKKELLENSGITQEKIAYFKMKNWLLYPTECGDNLDKLELVDTFMHEDYLYYIYKFTSRGMEDKGWMIGISGGYRLPNELSDDTTGHTFSSFETITDNYKEQAMGIIKLISEAWKKEAAKYSDN